MADLKQIEEFNKQVELLQDNLNNVVRVLDKQMLKKLRDNVTEADNFVDSFQRGENITKKLSSKLDSLQKEANKNSIIQLKLEKLIEDAKRRGNTSLEARLKNSLFQQKAYQRQIEQQQTFYNQLSAANKEQQKQNDVLGNIKNKYKEIVANNFTLAGIFKIIIDSALNFNKTSVDIGKNLGYGANNADRVTSNLVKASRASSNINFTLRNAAEAMSGLNVATGLVAEYSADTLETQIMLTKQFGLQADEAAGIYKLSVLNNKSASATNDAMVGAFVAARNSYRVGANFKQVMAEASKVSGQLAANLGYNPERITKAVVAMKAFGTTLEQTKAQGDALLNFESSLEAELKAELLTGQQINLERARAAALAGDQVELAKELANQGMTLEKFQSMNVLAQRSYAEALGLSADQLSDQLQKQKIAQEQGKSLAQITKEEALEAQKRQDIQEKFNAAILKLQDLIGGLVSGPLGQLLNLLGTALDFIGQIGSIATKIGESFGGIAGILIGLIPILRSLTVISAAFAANGLRGAIAAIYRSFAAIPFGLGIPLAIAAVAGLTSLLSSKKGDDIVSEGGYGKRTLLAPEGAIRLNDNDTVIAGTNLFKGDDVISAPKGRLSLGGNSNTETNGLLKQLIGATQSVANKTSVINMDGKKVGTTLVQNSYKLA